MLQRSRPADRHRSLSDSGTVGRLSIEEHSQIRRVRRLPHRVAGRTLTLDQIEQTVLPSSTIPRVFFALGAARWAGRLRSEAFVPARIEEQLADVASECVTRAQCCR